MELETALLTTILRTLTVEAYVGPENPKMTWFVDNEPGCGLLGTLNGLSAAEASKPLSAGDAATAATHLGHVLFSLDLANRALRGENAYEGAVWKDSWKVTAVDEAGWASMRSSFEKAIGSLLEAIDSGAQYADEMALTGVLGQVAHGAWHLGALRQSLGLVKTPARSA